MTLEIKHTERGFALAEFIDSNYQACSIQNSSIASQPHIWLGVDRDIDNVESVRMHLTQAEAADLIPLLRRFVVTGSISPDPEGPPEPTDWRQVASDLDRDNAKLAAEVKCLQAEIDTLRGVLKSSAGHTHNEDESS